jgi:hypothetical protein
MTGNAFDVTARALDGPHGRKITNCFPDRTGQATRVLPGAPGSSRTSLGTR